MKKKLKKQIKKTIANTNLHLPFYTVKDAERTIKLFQENWKINGLRFQNTYPIVFNIMDILLVLRL